MIDIIRNIIIQSTSATLKKNWKRINSRIESIEIIPGKLLKITPELLKLLKILFLMVSMLMLNL
jgi:hypothetical protein